MSKESDPALHNDSKSASSQHVRKRDKIFNLFRPSSAESKVKQSQSTKSTFHHLSIVSAEFSGDSEHEVSGTANTEHAVSSCLEIEEAVDTPKVKNPASNVQPSALPTKTHLEIFLHNGNSPVVLITLPEFGSRIDTTPQLALCIGLLANGRDIINQEDHPLQVLSSGTASKLAWIKSMKENPVEQERLRWLGARMVDEFAKDASKDSTKIAEMVLIGPVLDNEHFRRLLSCTITAFDQAVLLDVDLLQGLVQLVQSAPSEALLPDDLVKIFRIIRVHLQDIHKQSLIHPFHLTLAVSRLLDVMAEHKARDLDRVEDHEPLSGVLLGLRASIDPYLMYQACYAFQALQYVPNNETPLQAVLRHSTGVVDGLVMVSAVFKLDLGAILEGLGKLQVALGDVVEVVETVFDGVCSLMESGRGVLESIKERLGSGQKRTWYTAIRVACALAQAGQLKDLNTLIYEAPCRRDPLFQWGICQLLGEIASDIIWDTNVRLQAIALLGELYKNDPLWGQDESVRTWMLNIIRQLSATADQAVSSNALALLKYLNQEKNTATHLPYPLKNRLPLPTSSPTLALVQNIIPLECDLHKHKILRLEQSHLSLYIQPFAKASLRAKETFPLLEKVLEFLGSDRQVMLILGDSGSGKSTFNRYLEHQLWTDYKQGGPIPLFINLPAIDRPDQDLIAKQLRANNFTEDQIQEMKRHRQVILICDGYDESQQLVNLHQTNKLNQPGHWNTKMVISCRTQFLGPKYTERFRPQPKDHYTSGSKELFQEATIAPFFEDQIQQYVEYYIKELPIIDPLQDQPSRTADEYMDKLRRIPNLIDLVSNPFLLRLTLHALPSVVESNKDLFAIKITRVQLYDGFVKRWLEVNQQRLGASTLSNDERTKLNMLIEEDRFLYHGIYYQRRLALSIFLKHAGNPVVKYTRTRDENTWKAAFFCPEGREKLLFESSTVMRSGAFFSFLHRSLLEYFYSRTIYDPLDHDSDDHEIDEREAGADLMTSLSRMNIVEEPSIIQFLGDRVSQDPTFGQQLRDVIDQSKIDSSAIIAATNAITILVRAGVTFHGADLCCIKIPGADLSGGQFDSAQLQGSDLTNVNLSGSWLRQANLIHARLEGVQFGELPYLKMDGSVGTCAYSPDGRMLGVALRGGNLGISIYNTSTWQRLRLIKANHEVHSVAFSPDSQRIVCGDWKGMVQLWDCTSGEGMLTMEGHTDWINSLAYSPCGNQIASAGSDKTVRLWDAKTGVCILVLEGHTDVVYSVAFSLDGLQVVSCSGDRTIRFWDSETGKPEVILSPSLGEIYCLAISPDGRWIASGHKDGNARLWDKVSGSPGPVLKGHTNLVSGIAFSLNGQLIASSSVDHKVKLWDASTGDIISTFDGHLSHACDVAFSPDGLTIASGSLDRTVRLWEVNSSRFSIAIQDQIGDAFKEVYSPDGLSILSVHRPGFIGQRDAITGARRSVLFKLPDPWSIVTLEFLAGGNQIAICYRDGSVRLWHHSTRATGPVLKGHSSPVWILAYSPCGRWIASSDRDTVRLWDLQDTEQQYVLVDMGGGYNNWINNMRFSPTGHQLAICSRDGIVRIFDPRTRILLTSKTLMEGRILALDYSPNGQQLALGTQTSIAMWDLQSEEPYLELKVPPISSQDDCSHGAIIAYSPCGRFLAYSNLDNDTVHLWHRQSGEGDIESWSYALALRTCLGSIMNLSWNPVVPMEFITASCDRSMRLWQVSNNDGTVAVKMLWGTNISTLCTTDAVLEGATGLSPIHRKLLVQRGAIDDGLFSVDDEFDKDE